MLQAADLSIRLHPQDDVVIARVEIPTGTLLTKEKVSAVVTIPAGHKIAVRDIAQAAPVRRYNQIIGFTTRAIKAGEHVHVHNIAMGAGGGEGGPHPLSASATTPFARTGKTPSTSSRPKRF